MKTLLPIAVLSVFSALPPIVSADTAQGMKLHEENCIACHASRYGNDGTEIYTRPNHRIRDLAALKKQVNRCQNNLGLTWFDDEVDAVVDYLNKTFYQFE